MPHVVIRALQITRWGFFTPLPRLSIQHFFLVLQAGGFLDIKFSGKNCVLFIHSGFSLTTGSKPPPKRFFHIVRCRASSFKWEYPLLSLRSSSSFLRLLPRFLVTSISPFIFPSITCFRRQFLRKMWPIQLAFRFLISCRIFLCSLALMIHNKLKKKQYFLPSSILLTLTNARFCYHASLQNSKSSVTSIHFKIFITLLLTSAEHGVASKGRKLIPSLVNIS